MNKHACILLFFISFLFPVFAYANIEITEIMYDLAAPPSDSDADREWIEVHNTGSDAVNLSKWYLYDSSHHVLHPDPNGGVSELAPDGYAVIVQDITKFKIDWPQYAGVLFYASFPSLSNEGDTLMIKDNNTKDGVVADTVSYTASMGASEDGNSLQKINNAWVPGSPTPGAVNKNSVTVIPVNTNPVTTSSSVSNTSTPQIVKPKEAPVPKIRAEIIATTRVIAGIDMMIDVHATGLSGGTLAVGKFIWNFGDGSPVVVRTTAESFIHRYKYPGEYLLTLTFMEHQSQIKPDATDRLIVTVTSGDIVISRIGDALDPFVELENKSKYELDISNWMLQSDGNHFTIPEGTIILPGKKLIIGGDINGFVGTTITSVQLLEPSGVLATEFPIHIPQRVTYSSQVRSMAPVSHPDIKEISLDETSINQELPAAARTADVAVPIIILVILIVGSIVTTAFFIKRTPPAPVDDSEIVRNDIKIIE